MRTTRLHPGDRLVVILDESGEARLVSARKQVEKYCGMLAHRVPGRMLSEELIAERRAEARREHEPTAARQKSEGKRQKGGGRLRRQCSF